MKDMIINWLSQCTPKGATHLQIVILSAFAIVLIGLVVLGIRDCLTWVRKDR